MGNLLAWIWSCIVAAIVGNRHANIVRALAAKDGVLSKSRYVRAGIGMITKNKICAEIVKAHEQDVTVNDQGEPVHDTIRAHHGQASDLEEDNSMQLAREADELRQELEIVRAMLVQERDEKEAEVAASKAYAAEAERKLQDEKVKVEAEKAETMKVVWELEAVAGHLKDEVKGRDRLEGQLEVQRARGDLLEGEKQAAVAETERLREQLAAAALESQHHQRGGGRQHEGASRQQLLTARKQLAEATQRAAAAEQHVYSLSAQLASAQQYANAAWQQAAVAEERAAEAMGWYEAAEKERVRLSGECDKVQQDLEGEKEGGRAAEEQYWKMKSVAMMFAKSGIERVEKEKRGLLVEVQRLQGKLGGAEQELGELAAENLQLFWDRELCGSRLQEVERQLEVAKLGV